jgi:hypothetical protein
MDYSHYHTTHVFDEQKFWAVTYSHNTHYTSKSRYFHMHCLLAKIQYHNALKCCYGMFHDII